MSRFIALIIVIIVAICGMSAFLLTQEAAVDKNNSNNNSYSNTNVNNTTTNNSSHTGNTNHKGITDQNGVTASLNGPKLSSEGKTVQLTWKITNGGNETILTVSALDQSSSHEFGTIAPGESKSFTFSLSIPTLESVKQDFGPDSTVPNPFYIGGYSVTYNLNGNQFQFNANTLEIKLV
jgi:hypothetical protein